MRLGKLNYTLKELKAIPIKKRVLFIQFLIALTDINVLLKLLKYSQASNPRIKARKDAQFQISLNMLFSLSTKIYEVWSLIDKRGFNDKGTRIGKFTDEWFSKEFKSRLSKEGRKSLAQLEKYFKNTNNIKLLRNKIASHYDSKKIEKFLNNFDLESFDLYIPEEKGGGEYFSNANHLFLAGLVMELEKKEKKKTFDDALLLKKHMENIIGDVMAMANNLDLVVHETLFYINEKYFPDKKLDFLEIPNSKSAKKMHLNLFAET